MPKLSQQPLEMMKDLKATDFNREGKSSKVNL